MGRQREEAIEVIMGINLIKIEMVKIKDIIKEN